MLLPGQNRVGNLEQRDCERFVVCEQGGTVSDSRAAFLKTIIFVGVLIFG